jgi:hypothetical protein
MKGIKRITHLENNGEVRWNLTHIKIELTTENVDNAML